MSNYLWQKKGLIHTVDGSLWWAKTHAQVPTVDLIDSERLRIYFSSRDAENRSRIGFIEVCAADPQQVLYVHPEPVIDLGQVGTFDDCGVMPSWIVKHDGRTYLYYIGWNVRNTVPYHNSIGMAVSDDGRTFKKCFEGPIMDRTAEEPFFCATSCILIENDVWRNWYLSCTEWRKIDGRMEPRYHLKYAESRDGVHWDRKGIVAIDYVNPDEGGIVRASVIKNGSVYQMWYCYRSQFDYRIDASKSYRIGYAESHDGITWSRMDHSSGIDVSDDGWDSFMLAYPHVIDIKGELHMFYNGNGFGQSGFGYAVAKY
jgi:hypothetical protein